MKMEINEYEFAQQFKNMNRDNYSYEGYKELFDYYDQFENFDLDVIAICCEVSELTIEEIENDYNHLVDKDDYKEDKTQEELTEEEQEEYLAGLLNEIEQSTTVITLDNGSYLVWSF